MIDTFRTADSAKPGINDKKRLFQKNLKRKSDVGLHYTHV